MGWPSVYSPSGNGALRQGEVLSNVIQLISEGATEDAVKIIVRPLLHPFAIILSQDCDLDWDYDARSNHQPSTHHKIVPNTLFCEVMEAEVLKSQREMNSKIWKKIESNDDPRFQFLEGCPKECDALGKGIPALAIDFKRYFTVSTEAIYAAIGCQTDRRTHLVNEYLSHLVTRFNYFQMRVALPRDHGTIQESDLAEYLQLGYHL